MKRHAERVVRVLLLDDDAEDAALTIRLLRKAGVATYEVCWKSSVQAATSALEEATFDVMLLDYEVGAGTGLDVLKSAVARGIDTPAILLTGRGGLELDFHAMHEGVVDFIEKGRADASILERAVRYATERGRADRERRELLHAERRARSEAEAAHARTVSILESFGDGFAAIDADWKITYVNGSAAKMVEGSAPTLIGLDLWEKFPHIVGGDVEAAFRRAMSERRHMYVEGYSLPFDRWRAYDIYPWLDGVALYLRDITERRQAAEEQIRLAEALEAERALFRKVLEQLPIGVVIADYPSGQLTSGNAEVERIWRHSFRASPNLAAYAEWEGYYPDGRKYSAEDWPLARTFRTGQPVAGEDVRIRRGDGSSGAVRINSALVRDAHGATIAGVVTLEDVTKRVQADDAIRLQAQLLDTVEQAVIATDLDGVITYWNHHAEKLYGWTAAETVTRNIVEIGFGTSETMESVVSAVRQGQGWTGEIPLLTRSGAEFPAYVATTPILDRHGSVIGAVGISFDVTERRKSSEVLRDREQRLARIVEVQQEVAAAVLNQQRLMSLVIERAQGLTGATGSAVEMLEDDRLVSRAAVGAVAPYIGQEMDLHTTLSGRCIRQAETLMSDDTEEDDRVDRDLARQYGARSMICAPLIHDGRPVGVLKVVSDQPRRFQASDVHTIQVIAGIVAAGLTQAAAVNALSSREAHFRSLIENADPVMTLDEAGVITYVSPSVERILGLPPHRLLGSRLGDRARADDRERVRDALVRVVQQPSKPVLMEFRAQTATGDWRSLRLTARNLLDDRVVAGIVVNLHDATEEKLMAQQLRQAQKLEAVGQLAGGVAHDFNNLLTVISVHTEFLSSGLDRRDERFADLHEIRRAADRAAALTRQLLAFSRQQMLQPRIVDVNEIVSGLQQMLKRLIGEDIDFVTRESAESATVRADPGQLEQVLMNLAINARDAMPAGGQLAIEVGLMDEVDCSQTGGIADGRYVTLTVTDTGTGMTKDVREHIFDPFFTTKDAGKGTGLGLSTVYGIVKQSGGYIWVDSEPGNGTTFRVHLPFVDERVDRMTPQMVEVPRGGSETILLVEDEESVRQAARRILRQYGYRILEACDGRQALDMLRDATMTIDLIITDIVMPHMSGRDLVERVTELRGQTPALYISGYTSDELLRRSALDPGGVRLLQKPFTAQGLAGAAREAIQSQKRA